MRNIFVKRLYRSSEINKIDSKIKMLGKTNLKVYDFLNIRLITTIMVFLLLLYVIKIGYVLTPILTCLYYYLFYKILIQIPINKRAKKLEYEALTFLEILTLSLEAGRNLENALEITVSNVNSEFSNEFKQCLLEIKFGKSLIEAVESMKERIPSEVIRTIILNITQTDVFGNSILETMYHQIAFLRDKQLLEIRGQINKIPNKISIVSVIFMVPLILILILGPFIINFLG